MLKKMPRKCTSHRTTTTTNVCERERENESRHVVNNKESNAHGILDANSEMDEENQIDG